METLIGVGIWVIIFIFWYVRTYREKFNNIFPNYKLSIKRSIRGKKKVHEQPRPQLRKDFKSLVEIVENTCAMDKFRASDAASMVDAVKQLMEKEPASGQIWEAYALDSLETAEIACDDCRIPVEKTVRKTGVRIQCKKCGKWLALKNSKVTIINPSRADLDEWEK